MNESIFFVLVFFPERNAFYLLVFCSLQCDSAWYFWWNYFLNNLNSLDGLLRLLCFLMVHSYFVSDDTCSSTTVFILLHMEHQSVASFEHLLFFFFRLFYLSTRFLFVLILEFPVIYQLANLFSNFWLFLVLFWMLWMLVTVNKRCHESHAPRIATWETIFTETFFVVLKEWARSWSHTSVVTNVKMLAKKFLSVRPKTTLRIRKRKKDCQLRSVLRYTQTQ